MKRLFWIISFCIFPFIGNAQYGLNIDITDYSKLSEVQLELMLTQAQEDISMGKTISAIGTLGFVGGMAAMFVGTSNLSNTNYNQGLDSYVIGSIIMSISAIPLTWGIYKFWKGSYEQNKIQIHLLPFQSFNTPKNSTYGMQLAFKF